MQHMSTTTEPSATVTTSLRVPADLLARYDRLGALTERPRSFHLLKALQAYIDDQLWLAETMASAVAEDEPTAVTNAEDTADLISRGLIRPEDLEGPDPTSDEEYEAAQHGPLRWR